MSGDSIVIVRMAAQCALGDSLAACVRELQSGAQGVRAGDALEQQPKVHAGIGQLPAGALQDAGAARAERMVASALSQLLDEPVLDVMRRHEDACAMVVGTTLAGMRHCGEGLRAERDTDIARADAEFARMPAGSVLRAGLQGVPVRGPTISVSCACASALSAVVHGCALLESGAARLIVAGGYDPISEFAYGGFAALQLVAAGPLSPFAEDREGMKVGEGCALVLLCTDECARANGLHAIARIAGRGEASDAFHLTQPHPQGLGTSRALAQALAGGRPDVLLAHGTGTPGNDGAEYAAYRAALGEQLARVPVSALKSRVGHPLGAAGALELVLALACAEQGWLPAGAGRPVDRAAFPALDLVQGAPRDGGPRRIAALAAGFGGANAAVCVVRESERAQMSPRRDGGHAPQPRETWPSAVVRGIGAVTSGGRGVAGVQACATATWGGEPAANAALDSVLAPLLDPGRTRRMALMPRLMLGAVRDLVERTGLAPETLAATPLIAATWHGAADFTERYYRDLLSAGIDLANPMLFAESVPNVGSAHVSLSAGMTAASCTVVGTRTAGLQALHLAIARIRAGQWPRALVVAADESHPIVDRVLTRCMRTPVRTGAGAVAVLLEGVHAAPTTSVNEALRAEPIHACDPLATGVGHWSSASPCDAAHIARGCASSSIPELGSATALAVMAWALDRASSMASQPSAVVAADPCGVSWCVRTGVSSGASRGAGRMHA